LKKISLFLAAALLLGMLGGCGTETNVPTLQEPQAVTWQTAKVHRGDIAYLDVFYGYVARELEEAAFEAGGVLKALYVRCGDLVEQGQLLAELDTEALEKSLADVQKSMAQYAASYTYSLTQAQCDLEIARVQMEEITGGKSLAVLKAEKTAREAAVTALQSDIAALEGQIAALQETIAGLEGAAAPETGAQAEATPAPEASPAPDMSDALQQAKDALAAAEAALSEKNMQIETETETLAALTEQTDTAQALDLRMRQAENTITYLQDNYNLQMGQYGESAAEIEEEIAACSLYAANSGVVCSMTVKEPGVYVGEDPILYIAVEGTEYVCYNGERDIARTTARVEANVNGQLLDVTLIPYSNAEYTTLSRAGVTPPARFALPEGDVEAEMGTIVQLILYSGTREDVLLLPVNAVYTGSAYSEDHVYRIVDGEKVYTPITIGIKNETCVEIKAGLTEGDVVYVRE